METIVEVFRTWGMYGVGLLCALIVGAVGIVLARKLYGDIEAKDPGNDKMREIAEMIHAGAMAFLRTEYTYLAVFIGVVFLLLAWKISMVTALCFLLGAGCSMTAGFVGMQAATKANVRTSWMANQEGQGSALEVAFNGGAVMGLTVASLGMLGVTILYLSSRWFGFFETQDINGFAMGASSIALFARVGGGIYTKAADVGADLVGKVEAGIPEDDPRNPGVIAANLGDWLGAPAGRVRTFSSPTWARSSPRSPLERRGRPRPGRMRFIS